VLPRVCDTITIPFVANSLRHGRIVPIASLAEKTNARPRTGSVPVIYLDHCSTTPLDPVVAAAMVEAAHAYSGNPASQHRFGQAARRRLEAARERLATLVGADAGAVRGDRLIFTSGGTESNNLALRGLAGDPPGRILISSVEHPSILGPAESLGQSGFEIVRIPVDTQGVVRIDALREALHQGARLASIQAGNHETGVRQPLPAIAALCHEHQVPLHVDAVQAAGKVPIAFRQWNLAAMTFTAHKIHGPTGIGALVVRAGLAIRPQLWGGTQQLGSRPGTESVMLAVAFETALERALARAAHLPCPLAVLRDRLQASLLRRFPDAVVSGAAADRLPHVVNIAFPGVDRQALLLALDALGIACSTGPACQSGASEPSPVLRAMNASPEAVRSAVRLSVGATTTANEVDEAVDRIATTVERLRKSSGNHGFHRANRVSRIGG
jgi:cysteine desulfurase